MMEDYTFIITLAVIVQIIVLIVFFNMASNVKQIRQKLSKTKGISEYLSTADEEKFIGNELGYRENLLRAKYLLDLRVKALKAGGRTGRGKSFDYYTNEIKRIDGLLIKSEETI